MRIGVGLARGNFLLFFSQKTTENSHVPEQQLYAYAANDSTQNLRQNPWVMSIIVLRDYIDAIPMPPLRPN